MTVLHHPLPEPLADFDGLSAALGPAMGRLDAAQDRYRKHRDAGRILENSIEAFRVELTYHSNAIEGSTLSLRETQLVIEGTAPTSGKTMRELYEARNHDRALRMIEAWARARPAIAPIEEREILEVHGAVLADIDPAGAGRFRTERVLIKGSRHVPPGSQKFGTLIPAMIALANRPGLHPALCAAELHYNLVAVHPFADGNGRTARLLMNYLLLRHGYPLAIIEIGQRAEYLMSLEEANAGRCEPFALLVVRSLKRSIERLVGSD